jgi:hypothetical protein
MHRVAKNSKGQEFCVWNLAILSMDNFLLWDSSLHSINLIADSDFITVNNIFIKMFRHS